MWLTVFIYNGTNITIAGSSKIDSLKKALLHINQTPFPSGRARVGLDTQRIKLLNELSYRLHTEKPREALQYAQDALRYSAKLLESSDRLLNRFSRKSAVSALIHIGQSYNMLGSNDSAMIFFSKSFHAANEWNDKNGQANALYGIGVVHYGLGNYDKAARFFIKALDWFEETNDKQGVSYSLLALGFMHYYQRNFDKALECYGKSLKMAEDARDRNGIAYALNKIGIIHMDKDEFEKAINFQERALKIRQEMNDKTGLAASYNDLAAVYYTAGRKSMSDLDSLTARKYYIIAKEYFQRSVAFEEEIGNQWGVALTLANIGSLNTDLGFYRDAMHALNRCKDISLLIGCKDGFRGTYHGFAELFAKLNDYKNAYENYQLFSLYSDSMLNEESSKQVAEMQTKYESEKKEKEILILKKDKEIQNSEVRRQKMMRNSFIGAAALAVLLAFVLYNRYRIKQKANKQLSEQNERIRMQKAVIEEQKQNIVDSIEYASTIQHAMLPNDEEFRKLFPESFILFKPRDIVSGDFYWIASPPSYPPVGGKGITPPPAGEAGRGAVLLCTADCTGHGVPGAFMSMLCTELLNEAVNDKGLTEPNEIFEEVRKGIIAALKQNTGQTAPMVDQTDQTRPPMNRGISLSSTSSGPTGNTMDGMDAIIISLNDTSLRASCANNPVYIVSNGALTEIKPDRFPVGVYVGEQKSFTLHERELEKGDMVYAITDGYEDQLGSPPQSPPRGEEKTPFYGKKFKSKRLKELLVSIASNPVEEQKEILEKTFTEWKGQGEQTDDVTVIGIRV